MNVSLKDLPTYSSFARRFARRFIAERVAESQVPITAALHCPQPATWDDSDVTIAWLGHATVLINFYGTWLLTDPALRSRVGLRVAGATFGPRRLVHPALALRELPPLDAVLISHAHMDHSDLGTLRRLPRRTRTVVQRGNSDLVSRFARIDELAWGESVDINGARVEAIEVSHWGARMLTDQHRGYGGFLIEKNNRAIVFGGDTAYTRAFAKLRHRARIDLAILPIGAYDPYIHVHANPEQAWAMAREMGAEHILPIHHATFRLSREPTHEPVTRLLTAVGERESWRVAATEIGQTWVMPKLMASS